MNFSAVKAAYLEFYGEFYNDEFENFDQAFASAWRSFDYVPGATAPEHIAEAMCECWQLTQW